jgi:hypothetical protein
MLEKTNTFAISALALLTTLAAATDGRSASAGSPDGACRVTASPGHAILEARFWSTGSSSAKLSYGQSAVITGELTGDGAPLADATLEVEELLIGAGTDPGERVAVPRLGFAQTAVDGSFAYRVPAGPDREVVVSHRDQASETSCALRYFAAARPTLSAAPEQTRNRGRSVMFRGRLPGPGAAGRVVAMQARLGEGWITFREATTDRRGRFQVTYAFTRTYRRFTYTFRVKVPHQAGYPWLSGTSRLVPVTVYPEAGRYR